MFLVRNPFIVRFTKPPLGYKINEIYCRKCMTKDHILLGFCSEDCYSGCSDEEYIEEIENGRKQAEQRMEREMDQYCL